MTSGIVYWLVTQESLGIHPLQNSNLMYLDLNNHFKHSSLQFKFAIIELEVGIPETVNYSIDRSLLYSAFSSNVPKHFTACYIVTINCKTQNTFFAS